MKVLCAFLRARPSNVGNWNSKVAERSAEEALASWSPRAPRAIRHPQDETFPPDYYKNFFDEKEVRICSRRTRAYFTWCSRKNFAVILILIRENSLQGKKKVCRTIAKRLVITRRARQKKKKFAKSIEFSVSPAKRFVGAKTKTLSSKFGVLLHEKIIQKCFVNEIKNATNFSCWPFV